MVGASGIGNGTARGHGFRRAFAVGAGLCALLVGAAAQAALVPQMGRCAPPFGDLENLTNVVDQFGAGIYNAPGEKKLTVFFAWAKGPGDASIADSINSTSRVELCIVDQAGFVSCPACSRPSMRSMSSCSRAW